MKRASTQRKVEVARDHVATLIGASPIRAVIELLWNALDAGGSRVDATLQLDGMGAVTRLEISDRGPGIDPADLDRAFGRIGDSVKLQRRANADGRAYHGHEGKGRFKALSLAPVAVWQTTYADGGTRKAYEITVRRDAPDYFEASVPKATSRPTGTRVVLESLDNGHIMLGRADVRERLAEEFAAYLASYPGVTLVWDQEPLDVDSLIARRETIEVLPVGAQGGPVSLDIVEWKFKPDARRLHFCDERGFSYHEIPVGVQSRGMEFTAYLRSPQVRQWAETARFVTEGLDQEISGLLERAKDRLREYVRERLAEDASSVVQEWKDQNIYPYGREVPSDPLAKAEQEVFDIVAVQINEQHPTFDKSDPNSKRLTLALIRQALESNPSTLTKVLREVVSLADDDLRALAELLERAPLSNLIRAGKLVADRLDTILAFEQILFDPEWKQRLLERTQLHRLLVHEIWLLGEEYTIAGDDEGLTELLKKHVKILGRDEPAPEVDVTLINGKEGIPDLMLSRRRKVDRDRFEHLVVELKRPRDPLGLAEVSQIQNYAFAVARDERFNTVRCNWEFVLLGNDLDANVEQLSSSKSLPEGCIHDGKSVRIWVRRWADVLSEARGRFEFFREQLAVEASHSKGLALLKERYPHLFEGRGVRKRRDLAASQKAISSAKSAAVE